MSSCRKDDQDQFQAVHLLATNHIGEPAEANLTENCTSRRCDLDSSVGALGDDAAQGLWQSRILPVNYTEHGGDNTDSEDVVGVGKKADAGDQNCADMVPAEGRLIDLSKGETAALVWVGDMSVLIVKVGKCSI